MGDMIPAHYDFLRRTLCICRRPAHAARNRPARRRDGTYPADGKETVVADFVYDDISLRGAFRLEAWTMVRREH